jgi:hypothetical protein
MRYDLKIVPNAQPNADGEWIEAEVPKGFDIIKLTPKPDHHVVAVRTTQDPREGGPMHLMSRPLSPAPYQFEASWLLTANPVNGLPQTPDQVRRERDLLLLSQLALLTKVKQLQRRITKTKRQPRPTKEPELSKAAKQMLERLRAGRFYRWDPHQVPKAMAELEGAGLVGTCGRVQTIVRCWVTADGYLPFVPEMFEEAGQ